jgi:hypothetical protein
MFKIRYTTPTNFPGFFSHFLSFFLGQNTEFGVILIWKSADVWAHLSAAKPPHAMCRLAEQGCAVHHARAVIKAPADHCFPVRTPSSSPGRRAAAAPLPSFELATTHSAHLFHSAGHRVRRRRRLLVVEHRAMAPQVPVATEPVSRCRLVVSTLPHSLAG